MGLAALHKDVLAPHDQRQKMIRIRHVECLIQQFKFGMTLQLCMRPEA